MKYKKTESLAVCGFYRRIIQAVAVRSMLTEPQAGVSVQQHCRENNIIITQYSIIITIIIIITLIIYTNYT